MLNEIEFLVEELGDGHRQVGSAISSLTSEVAQWQPGGNANSIAALLAHSITGEDRGVNQFFGAGQTIFEKDGWAAKTGIPADNRQIWQAEWTLDIAAFDEYRREVQRSMEALLGRLTAEDLDKDAEAFGRTMRAGWIMRVVISNHILSHMGEVSVLRGMKGLGGLPI